MRHWAKHILPAGGVALLGAVLVLGACGGPSRDAAASAAPVSAAPVNTAPAVDTTRANGAVETATIASGSNLALASAVRLCSGISRPANAFTATVTGSVIGSHGAVIPVGSIVLGHLVDSRDSLVLAFDSLAVGGASYAISARMVGSPQMARREFRSKGVCIPQGGRMTIQLTTDLPLGK
jgi:hypothetical protein